MVRWSTAVVTVGLSAGCVGGPPAPTLPPLLEITGAWTGFATEQTAPMPSCTTGEVVAMLTQTGTTATGTWSVSYPDPACDSVGTVNGVKNGNVVDLTYTVSTGTSCSLRISASLSGNGRVISGRYETAMDCPTAAGGQISLNRS